MAKAASQSTRRMNRRTVLAGAAAAAVPGPALALGADGPDPILAVIEARKATWAAVTGSTPDRYPHSLAVPMAIRTW